MNLITEISTFQPSKKIASRYSTIKLIGYPTIELIAAVDPYQPKTRQMSGYVYAPWVSIFEPTVIKKQITYLEQFLEKFDY